jgi:predicted adenine nucleotide alpha hydrolase (AANH) superfamily ATPase
VNILLHVCCAPCAIYPLARLAAAGAKSTGFFYNPNIHPYQEYSRRLAAARELAARTGLPLIVHEGYDLDEFLLRVAGTGPGRCERCYRMRLAAAAAAAREGGFDWYTTSLLYSRYQKHDLIRSVALEMGREQGVELYYEDFRAGWREGIAASKAMGLYRQQYCGCIYSERERYQRTAPLRKEPGAQ